MWSHPLTVLWVVFGSFYAQGNWGKVTKCHFVQGVQSFCCFHQAAALFPDSCNYCLVGFSHSKVEQFSFDTALSPTRPVQGSTTGPVLGGWLVAQPLPSAFVTFPTFVHWEFGSLPHLLSLGQLQHSTLLLLLLLNWNSLFIFSVLLGRIHLPRDCTGFCCCVEALNAWCVLFICLFCTFIQTALELLAGLGGRYGMLLFSVRQGMRRLSTG
jgi:hypothetical protein